MLFFNSKAKVINLFFLISVFLFFNGYSQEKIVTGNVKTFKTFPLKNVKVKSKKLKNEVLTDSLGNFSIKCSKKDILKFDAFGFQNYSEKIKKQSNNLQINLIYVENEANYRDILKYGYLSKKNLDYCVNNLLEDNNNYDRYASILDIIQSIYPSARFSQDPNDFSDVITLESRGPNTILAKPNALLVVDGIVVESISNIEPQLVKSVKVLVGTDAGHWGMRGGNGVIEITLKSGAL